MYIPEETTKEASGIRFIQLEKTRYLFENDVNIAIDSAIKDESKIACSAGYPIDENITHNNIAA
jgi:hypothetical protein